MSDTDITRFQFRDMAEVRRALNVATAENWSGTFSPEQLRHEIERGTVLTSEFAPYVWKVNKIRGQMRIIPNTWLTSPYTPRIAPNAKLP